MPNELSCPRMNPKFLQRIRTAIYLIVAAVATGAIIWAESEIIYCVNFLKQRAEALSSEHFHLSDQLEIRVRALNDNVFRYSFHPETERKGLIESEAEAVRAWLADHQETPVGNAHRRVLSEIESWFARYNAHVSLVLQSKVATSDLPVWRTEKEQLLHKMLSLTKDLGRLEKETLSGFMQETQFNMSVLYRKLILSSLVLLIMGGVLGYLAYLGIILPLQARLRQTQSVMERQEKLSSLGVLAAGVAHEIRNPLTSIKARLFTQQSQLEANSEALEDNLFITEEISRLEKIVADFLMFARPSEPHRVSVNSAQSLRDVATLVRPALEKANISLKTEFQTEAQIFADPGQLKQVLINLLQNSAESIGRDGFITLRTRTQTKRRLPQGATLVVLEVEDSGKGITPEAQKRLFDPFFTTKPSGTGLGLSIAARILEKHEGSLEYQPAPIRGSIFRLLLPISSEQS